VYKRQPQEGPEALLTTIRHINGLPVWGVKLQMLHVLKDADLSKTYEAGAFELWDRETYVETVCDALELLRPDIVIHRLTGDGKRENLVAPLWTTDKRRVLTEIQQEMLRRKSHQGMRYSGNNIVF
ncbi:MAG: TIGR01212 family radical SAM protein, partial [Clostridia bacterium]|nr:TIGR01212 family radical SAM protein [Clostridia bacterium]